VDLVLVWNKYENKYGIEKSVGDRFAIKNLKLKFMMISHKFMYTCDIGEKKKICPERRDERYQARKHEIRLLLGHENIW
jgi:hypothetical protein